MSSAKSDDSMLHPEKAIRRLNVFTEYTKLERRAQKDMAADPASHDLM